MNEYDFALVLKVPFDVDPETYIDPLFEAGCDDCSQHFGKCGYLELDFIREATNASEAITSAIRNVRSAIPEAELLHIAPDIVGVSEIGQIMKCSRQYVQQIVNSSPTFPIAIHNNNKGLWHLIDVLKWLKDNNKRVNDISVWLEIAAFARTYNNARNHQNIVNEYQYEPEVKELIYG